ncbi:hypothetical protein [Hymenobacter sp. GOD-10R]|uniref:hypothetical protein n=1 Tax=Hymenobacter sp. GOD-10R TaxID=3093922 RepID=UPI002D764C15|nr:hypothetical protein [Hymenobacter sp. GOD-10R]WRQ29963.1 hypothetical protein SD425_06745 [Hymenobacter sp. GOD-10R]
MERRIMITEKSESTLSITKTPSSVIKDYRSYKSSLLIILLFFIAMLIISKDAAHTFTASIILFSLIFCTPILWQITKLKKQFKEGHTTTFNKTSEEVYINKDSLYSFNDISSVLVGPYYDGDNTYSGHEIKLKAKGKDFTIESCLKEDADIKIAIIIVDFINKPLIQVEGF